MKEDDKDIWINQLREKLDGYSEEVPDEVWDALERRYDHKVVPLWRKWQSVAAIIFLAVASSSLIYLWNISVPYDYIQNEQNKLAKEIKVDAVLPETDITEKLANVQKRSETNVKVKKNLVKIIGKNVVLTQNSDSVIVDNNVSEGDYEAQEKKVDKVYKEDEKNIIHTKKKYAYNNAVPASKSKKWSVAISSGGMGVSSTSNISGTTMRFSNASSNAQSDVMNSPDMSGNNYFIDKYYNKIEYINSLETKKKHYQPVTFGISFKFDMDKDWAFETGLTYTYLYSKLESGSISNIVHQQQSLKYIGVPLKFSRNLFSAGKMNFYGSAGGEVEKCISGKLKTYNKENGIEKLESAERFDITQLQWSLSTSLGAEYMLARKMSLYAEPGIVYYFDDKSGVETIRNEHPLNFNIKLGLRFTFTK